MKNNPSATNNSIIFAPLPPSKATNNKHVPKPDYINIARILRRRPYEWARIHVTTNHDVAHRINHGRPACFTIGEYEATLRKRDDNKFDVWARYIGLANTDTAAQINKLKASLARLEHNLHSRDLATAVHATQEETANE